jgi:hypothetical protein
LLREAFGPDQDTIEQRRKTMPDIVGTWRLVAARSVDSQGQPLLPPYGPQAMGRIVFSADKRILVAICDGRPELPVGVVREYGGYCGDYAFDGTTLITQVDAAPNVALVGTAQKRDVRFEGKRMVLQPPPREIGGVMHHRELTWERISPV